MEEGEPVATGSGLAEIKASKFVGGDLTVNEAAFLAFSSHKALVILTLVFSFSLTNLNKDGIGKKA